MLSGDVQIQVLMPMGFMGGYYFDMSGSGSGFGLEERSDPRSRGYVSVRAGASSSAGTAEPAEP